MYFQRLFVEITIMILCRVKMSINGVIEVKSLGLDIIILFSISVAVDKVFVLFVESSLYQL